MRYHPPDDTNPEEHPHAPTIRTLSCLLPCFRDQRLRRPAVHQRPGRACGSNVRQRRGRLILDRLEAKGQAIKGISTNVTYNDVRFEPVEEKIVKKGELLFLRGNPSSKFLIRFDETIAGGVKRPKPEYYLFDGRWMTERNDATKQIIKREVVREGQSIDPFKLKKGPFPLPFGHAAPT